MTVRGGGGGGGEPGAIAGAVIWDRMATPILRSRGPVGFMAAVSATPELDIAANLEALRSGDVARIKNGLRFLAAMGPRAMRAREEIEKHLGGSDPEISELAHAALRAIGGEDT